MTNYSNEQLKAAGGSAWTHPETGQVRFYFSNLENFIGLQVFRYGTGNVSSATMNGVKISNSKANKALAQFAGGKFWFDAAAEGFCSTGLSDSTHAAIVDAIVQRLGAK